MKRYKVLLLSCLLVVGTVSELTAQKYLCRDAHARFHSKSPLEDIEANNYQVSSVIDFEKNEMAFQVLMKGFHFEKALMEEHFNEKYVESDTYPKATFKGSFSGAVDLAKDADYPVSVTGDLTIHGVTQPMETEGTFTVKDGKLSGQSHFRITLADYEINIPKLVAENIAEVIDIYIEAAYELYGQ